MNEGSSMLCYATSTLRQSPSTLWIIYVAHFGIFIICRTKLYDHVILVTSFKGKFYKEQTRENYA